MEQRLQRWVDIRSSVRVICWCVVSGVIAVAVWGLLVRPVGVKCAELEALSIRARQLNAALWPGAGRQPVAPVQRLMPPVQPFSPLDFQDKRTALVHWKPQQNGGELVLDALWSDVPALFSRLAQQAVRISAFNLAPEGATLRLSLQLESDHAQ